jgi:hypothetical protein
MAVQLPIRRNEPMQQQSVGRMDVDMPDVSQAVRVQGQAADRLAGAVTQFVVQEEENAANVARRNAEWEFSSKMLGELERIKHLEGDTDEAYAKWEEQAAATQKELREKYVGSSTAVNDRVAQGLQEEFHRLYDRKTVAQAAQRDKYWSRVYESRTNQILETDFPDSVQALDVTSPNAGADTYAAMVKLEKLHEERGLQNGTVTRREDGSLEWSPIAQDALAQARSKGLINSIKTLSNVGEVEKAEFIQEKFGAFINKIDLKAAKGETQAAKLEREALTWLMNNRKAGQGAVASRIDSIPDPVLQARVRNLYDDELNQKERIIKNLEGNAYRNGMRMLEQKRQELGREPTLEEMRKDANFRNAERSSGLKAKALRGALGERPKMSDPEEYAQVINKLATGEYDGMSWEEVNEDLGGLNATDYNFARKVWTEKQIITEPEKRKAYNSMSVDLAQLLRDNGYLRKEGRNTGKTNPRDKGKEAEAKRMLLEKLSTNPFPASDEARIKYIKGFANSLKSGELFVPPAARQIPDKPVRENTPQAQTERAAAQRKQGEYLKQFMRENNFVPDAKQLRDYIKAQEANQ